MQRPSTRRGAPVRPRRHYARLALRVLAFGFLWLLFTDNRPEGYGFGLAAVAGCVWISARLVPPRTVVRPLPLLGLIGYLGWESVRSGFDIALRALRPSLPIRPGMVCLTMRDPSRDNRILLAYVASAVPGTVAVDFFVHGVQVHVLDRRQSLDAQVARVERGLRRAVRRDGHD